MFSTSIITPSNSISFSSPKLPFNPNSQLVKRVSSNSKLDSFYSKICRNYLGSKSPTQFQFKVPNFNGVSYKNSSFTSKRFFTPVMQTQDCTVKMEVDVPVSVAYESYLDRESIPKWMPFISTVKVLEDKPDQSKWTLKYKAFGQDIELSWLARNLQPIPNQKIHWRSLEGLPNSGAVRFYPRGPSACLVELTVSYEVPQLLTPVASALQPFLESLLLRGLERFSKFAKSNLTDSTN